MKKNLFMAYLILFSIFVLFSEEINFTENNSQNVEIEQLEAAESYFVEYLNAINKTQKRLVLMNKKDKVLIEEFVKTVNETNPVEETSKESDNVKEETNVENN